MKNIKDIRSRYRHYLLAEAERLLAENTRLRIEEATLQAKIAELGACATSLDASWSWYVSVSM